jgi:hypothetical protein
MKEVSRELNSKHGKRILYLRVNSDHLSLDGSDPGCINRAKEVANIIKIVEADNTAFPDSCFRLSLLDMPEKRRQKGTSSIPGSSDVYISWLEVQQTVNPTDPAILKAMSKDKTMKAKARRSQREQ